MSVFKLERENAYDRVCVYCGDIVGAGAGSGKAFLHFDTYTGKDKWRARHDDCTSLLQCRKAAGLPVAEPHPFAKLAVAPKRYTLAEVVEAVKEVPALAEAERLAELMQQAIADAVKAVAGETADVFNSIVPEMIAETLASHRPVAITVGEAPAVVVGTAHKALETIFKAVIAGVHPFIVGPAGSGKTTLAEQVATTLGRKFYMEARVTSEYKLIGFIDANGKTVRTAFRECYENGGVFLFDEVDASEADALTAFNAALANGMMAFPDGMVKRYVDFVAIAAGNTYGRGADRQYVGRNQLDAATLDRFAIFTVDYDEELELKLAGNDTWTRKVQAWRKAAEREKIRHIISPRASIMGTKLLAAGMSEDEVAEAVVFKGLDDAQRRRIITLAIPEA